ncbi:glycine cleavage system aminomethyltransferase GcvT [Raoultibacter phocaeensis]|uniref:glycine cleavage system aminomethyltransferase GcvT n=1 Tax=Raoultibacter phocaeensis TaxID=2479841 RepID=UPI001119E06F|nr:glycine cleavage system aminomethyltransferase GcvT [Raoultibacter phocaeensis]
MDQHAEKPAPSHDARPSTDSTGAQQGKDHRTPLYDSHLAAEGKIVPFAGYLLPIEYPTGLMKEHLAVRNACGLFDVSHMGEVLFGGPGALATLNHLMTNDFSNMAIGRCRYTALCYEDGGMVDDLIVYKLGEERFLAVVNAANKDKDVAWMSDNLLGETEMRDLSDDIAQIAVQGSLAQSILSRVADEDGLPARYYTFSEHVSVAGCDCLVSRTGYTGEDGFELYCAPTDAPTIWSALLEAGAGDGLIPCGLGARDTLRLEAGMPLYGHEMDETVDPLEAGLAFAVKLDKPQFIGKAALVAKGDPARMRIGLEVTGRGIIREHEPVLLDDVCIGTTTSGTFCPFLKKACAMALVDTGSVAVGDEVEVEVRGRRVAAAVVPLPFYQRSR